MDTQTVDQIKRKKFKVIAGIIVIALFLALSLTVYAERGSTLAMRIVVDRLDLSGLTLHEAEEKLTEYADSLLARGVQVLIDSTTHTIEATNIDFEYATDTAITQAWSVGRKQNIFISFLDQLRTIITGTAIPLAYDFNESKLREQIATIAHLVDQPGKDIRLRIEGTDISILTDTKLGFELDQAMAYDAVVQAIASQSNRTQPLSLQTISPTVALPSAERAKVMAQRILSDQLQLKYSYNTFTQSPAELGTWIHTEVKGEHLELSFDKTAIGSYVTTIADALKAEPQAPQLTILNGKVSEFVAPEIGRSLDQDATVASIISILRDRADDKETIALLDLAVKEVRAEVTDASATELGIIELIGTATTKFTGSPANRIANIKNGAKFLTGILIKPGEEFSTVQSLGRIDNTTGYLPELVIKGNRTVPEFGGGLCQVSTTLFRSVLNTGLPITARQNHSYRVSYYESDGDGNYVGPGLDATIYSPNPDFKFINNTGSNILIQGSVYGDQITFDIYGTKDGRSSAIDGPYQLSSTPPGEPIYVETDTLAPGVEKRLEYAHNGGSAIATYSITYADGSTEEQVFKSYYRNWPARYLVGADPNAETAPDEEAPEIEATVE